MSLATPPDRELSAQGMRFAIVATHWNPEIVDQLLQGAQLALSQRKADGVEVHRCPGAFELGPLAARVARKGGIDGIIALGCLIRGGTDHYRVLCDEVARARPPGGAPTGSPASAACPAAGPPTTAPSATRGRALGDHGRWRVDQTP